MYTFSSPRADKECTSMCFRPTEHVFLSFGRHLSALWGSLYCWVPYAFVPVHAFVYLLVKILATKVVNRLPMLLIIVFSHVLRIEALY